MYRCTRFVHFKYVFFFPMHQLLGLYYKTTNLNSPVLLAFFNFATFFCLASWILVDLLRFMAVSHNLHIYIFFFKKCISVSHDLDTSRQFNIYIFRTATGFSLFFNWTVGNISLGILMSLDPGMHCNFKIRKADFLFCRFLHSSTAVLLMGLTFAP